MDPTILGRIKSDGYRYMVAIYRFIESKLNESKIITQEDQNYIRFACQQLNMLELLRRKRDRLICLVLGFLENNKRYFKQERFYPVADRLTQTVIAYTSPYAKRFFNTISGKALFVEKSHLTHEIKQLLKYYNYNFYGETCAESIISTYKNYISAILSSANKDEIKEGYLERPKSFCFSLSDKEEEEIFDVSHISVLAQDTIAMIVPKFIRHKIFDFTQNYIAPIFIDHRKAKHQKDGHDVSLPFRHADVNRHPNTAGEMGSDLYRSDENGDSRHSCEGRNLDKNAKHSNKGNNDNISAPLGQGLDACLRRHDDAPAEQPQEECGIPDELIHNLDSLSITDPTTLSQELAEYYTLSKKIQKGEAYIDKATERNQPATSLTFYVIKLKLRQAFIKRRLLLNHNHEIKQETEGIG